ncbi:FlhC family transcriptional regulator [Methylicorpusculum sp.]|uniref:FlhC family transcriptional regulator n=1 Tax=Methylicorpusculum sp. TaxID=2713644 RepID=UPI002732EC99|nr:FlhC family transcriptional regulator [Methylicorpusculum sp.]MDP3530927.1 FlhC family transcriptional regulator [Methylicorpusculum sp.]MDZ4152524.1 FlhC family transcriptional regulator [Methylicorpusculum sp.]
MLDHYKQQSLAIELIKRKARITLMQEVTGLPKKWLRQTFREYHGFPARSGDNKQSIQALTRTNKQYKEATAFAVCYRHAQLIVDQSDIDNVINAFDVFKTMHPASRLSFSETDVIIKELIANKIELTRCPVCNCWNLLRARMDQVERCGVCKEHIKAK